jgi:hypothetical protein
MSTTAKKVPTDAAIELIHELKALEASGAALAPFDEKRVQDAAAKVAELDAEFAAHLNNEFVDRKDPFYVGLPVALRAAMNRNKRCIAAYNLWRLNSLTGLWWEGRDHETTAQQTPAERDFLREYNSLLCDYMAAFDTPLDLRAFISRPPTFPPSSRVEVLGLRDHSFVSPVEFKLVTIEQGNLSKLAFEDAEPLVLQGVAKYTSSSHA